MDQPSRPNHGGQPPALDQAKRDRIIALVANGSSRRVAARFVGCAPSTVTRTAIRDPEFAAALAHAEELSQVELVRLMRNAARKERYWRAAAWLLERINPQDFTLPAPGGYTIAEFHEVITIMVESLSEGLPEESLRRAMDKLDELTADLGLRRGDANAKANQRRDPPSGP